MRILILDDDHTRHKHFNRNLIGHVVENTHTAEECIDELKDNEWDVVFLDHDLGGEVYQASAEGTGWEVAKWLHDNPKRKPNTVIVHSFNPTGAKNMIDLVEGSVYLPSVWTDEKFLKGLKEQEEKYLKEQEAKKECLKQQMSTTRLELWLRLTKAMQDKDKRPVIASHLASIIHLIYKDHGKS